MCSPLAFVVTSVTDRDEHMAAQADSSLSNRIASMLSGSLATDVSVGSPVAWLKTFAAAWVRTNWWLQWRLVLEVPASTANLLYCIIPVVGTSEWRLVRGAQTRQLGPSALVKSYARYFGLSGGQQVKAGTVGQDKTTFGYPCKLWNYFERYLSKFTWISNSIYIILRDVITYPHSFGHFGEGNLKT